MTTYILYTNGIIEKDGDYVWIDAFNPNYQDYLAWLALGNTPLSVDASVYLAKAAQVKLDKQQLKQAYQTMIDRLEQIQAAVSPTNAQVIQAIRDEALYIKRVMKVLEKLI